MHSRVDGDGREKHGDEQQVELVATRSCGQMEGTISVEISTENSFEWSTMAQQRLCQWNAYESLTFHQVNRSNQEPNHDRALDFEISA